MPLRVALPRPRSSIARGRAYVLLGAAFWSLGGLFIKEIDAGVGSITFFRCLFAAMLLGPLLRGQRFPRPPDMLISIGLFAALLGLNRAFALELENDALAGLALAPADRGWIFLGKALANVMLIFGVQLVTAAAFGLAFDVPVLERAAPLAAVLALGALGLAAAGTLFGAVAVRTRFRELVLPLLLLPLLVPVLIAAVRATAGLLETGAIPPAPLRLLLVADAVFWIASYVLFEFVLDE
jgi:heme exporter protein B